MTSTSKLLSCGHRWVCYMRITVPSDAYTSSPHDISQELTGSLTSTPVTFVPPALTFPPYDTIDVFVALDKRGALHITEKSPFNWTVIASQIVAGWGFAVWVFSICFSPELRRFWGLPFPRSFHTHQDAPGPYSIQQRERTQALPNDLYSEPNCV
jgi:hypothetical protein